MILIPPDSLNWVYYGNTQAGLQNITTVIYFSAVQKVCLIWIFIFFRNEYLIIG
jgi:hypothetical protein